MTLYNTNQSYDELRETAIRVRKHLLILNLFWEGKVMPDWIFNLVYHEEDLDRHVTLISRRLIDGQD